MSGATASGLPLSARIAAAVAGTTGGLPTPAPIGGSKQPDRASTHATSFGGPISPSMLGVGPIKPAPLPAPIPNTPKQKARPDGAKPTLGQNAIATANYIMYGKAVFDGTRVGLKLSQAKAAGLGKTAVRQMLTAAPTTTIINPEFPAVGTEASKGMSFTARDAKLYGTSMALGGLIATVQVGSGVLNIRDGLRTDGIAGLEDTKSGRSGVLQLLAGGLPLSLMGVSGVSAALKGASLLGVGKAAIGSAALTQPWVAGVAFGATALTMMNEWGYFDFLDKGNTRSVGTVLHDAMHNTPVLGWFV